MSLIRDDVVNIMRYLPEYITKDVEIKSVLDTGSEEHEQMRLSIDDMFKQFFISTATWGLTNWERVLALKPSSGDSYQTRRNRILLYLQSHQTSTVEYLEKLSDRHITGGTSRIVEHNTGNYFNIYIDGDIKNVKIDVAGIHEAIDIYKPAHLGYGMAILPGRRIGLNHCGPVTERIVGNKKWIETQKHIIFDDGLNAAGPVEIITTTSTRSEKHSAFIYKAGTINGRLNLNKCDYSATAQDVGGNVIETWLTFVGGRMNSQQSPRLNDVPSILRSKTYHQANWQEVVNYHNNSLNTGSGREKTWTTTTTISKMEKRFKRPYYALNKFGLTTVEREDVGTDETITETLFCGERLNGAEIHEAQEQNIIKRSTSFVTFTGARLNTRTVVKLNNSVPKTNTVQEEKTIVKTMKTFTGALLNGTLKSNRGEPVHRTKVVHIPKWRDVVKRQGSMLLNAVKHHAVTVEIERSIPGVVARNFDSANGTLLNNHAAIGYLRL